VNKTAAVVFLCCFCAAAVRAETVSATYDDLALTAAATGDTLVLRSSSDRGLNWSASAEVRITGESLSQPRAAIDPLGKSHLVFLAFNRQLQRTRLYYTGFPSPEPRVLCESLDELSISALAASAECLTVSWEAGYQERQTAYWTVSLDQGRHFGSVRSSQFRFESPPAPSPVRPANGAVTALATQELGFLAAGGEPVAVKVELSTDPALAPDRTWAFELFCLPGTAEAVLRPPFSLPDGHYYWRLSASDGLASSPVSDPASFEVDTRPPVIGLSAPSGEVSDDRVAAFSGRLNETARLSLNGRPVSLEANGQFNCDLELKSGQNRAELVATDEAGNTARLVKLLSYNPAIPHFQVLRPKEGDWFKPGAACYFEAAVSSESAIADESEGEISLNGRLLADKPVYDQNSKTLSGFASLPPALADGKYTASVSLLGGRKDFAVNIDSSAPVRTVTGGEAVYTGSATLVPLPLADAGSGLDLQGTLVKMNGVSLEVLPTGEARALTRLPLADGSYEVTVLPRDRVGNTAEAFVYRLVVDTQPPSLFVLADPPAATDQARTLISGEAGDQHLAAVNFYNGAALVGTVRNAPGAFSFSCPLVNGYNAIRVEAIDSAGNKTTRSLAVRADLATAGLITRFAAAPVPFSPRSGDSLYFTFAFSATPDLLRIYILDLAGTTVWRRDLPGMALGNSVAWDGRDSFGRRLDNGVYPYLAVATLGAQTEIKRGKLIVLQ